DRILPLFDNVDVIVYGHSHVASNHTRDGVLFFNPGTATGYSSSGIHSIGVLELGDYVRGKIIVL
ncbi:MAG: metallophosphoesterase family protein, partial [Proteobacteria bacterium]|nr:metallophosphoesterase family protein [Pseudomonadota bacterium]